MSTVLAWERLFDGVVTSFAADGITCDNVFGWRTPRQHAPRRARIAWVPGDPTDAAGVTGPARNPGGIPRSLAVLGELFTVYISHQDATAPEDERRQYHLTRLLRDVWFRAVYRLAVGTIAVRSEVWLNDTHLERRYGATLRVVCELQAPVFDILPDELLALGPGGNPTSYVDAVAEAAAQGTTLGADLDVVLMDTLDGPIVLPPGQVPPVGGGETDGSGNTHVQTTTNKNMPARTTVSDGDLATAIAVQHAPSFGAFVNASVNGVLITDIGNGTKVADAYFSGDGGATARAWSAIQVGDTFHWNGSRAGYQLTAGSDVIAFWYEEGS